MAPTVVSTTIDGGGVLARPDLWNTLTVVFDADVAVAAEDLSLLNDSIGGALVNLSGIGFSYNSSTNTATWDFSTLDPLEAAFYTYQLDAAAITSEGLTLDGDGDGTGGDDFVDQHYLAIPGDANLDGVVDVLGDAFVLVGNLNSTTNLAYADGNFNADGVVNVLGDAFILIGNLGRDVRPAGLASSNIQQFSFASPTFQSANLDEQKVSTVTVSTLPTTQQLILAGDQTLRDDIFGSEF